MRVRFLSLWSAVLMATAVSFIVHLFLRFETIRLGYELDKERRQQEQLLEQRRVLALEAASLRQADRVETIARAAYGMDVVAASRVIAVPSRAVPRISGRAQ
jgi:cell division protein FtsL